MTTSFLILLIGLQQLNAATVHDDDIEKRAAPRSPIVFPLMYSSSQPFIKGWLTSAAGSQAPTPFYGLMRTTCVNDGVSTDPIKQGQQVLWGATSAEPVTTSVRNNLFYREDPKLATMCFKSPSVEGSAFSQLIKKAPNPVISYWWDTSIPFGSKQAEDQVYGEMTIGGSNPSRFDASKSKKFRLVALSTDNIMDQEWTAQEAETVKIGTDGREKSAEITFSPSSLVTLLPPDLYSSFVAPLNQQGPTSRVGSVDQNLQKRARKPPVIFDCTDMRKLQPLFLGTIKIAPSKMVVQKGDGKCSVTVKSDTYINPDGVILGNDVLRHFHVAVTFNPNGDVLELSARTDGEPPQAPATPQQPKRKTFGWF